MALFAPNSGTPQRRLPPQVRNLEFARRHRLRIAERHKLPGVAPFFRHRVRRRDARIRLKAEALVIPGVTEHQYRADVVVS